MTESPTKENFNSQSEWLDIQKSRQAVGEDVNEDEGVKLVLLGSARHREDLDRVQELRKLAVQLGIEVCFLSLCGITASLDIFHYFYRSCVPSLPNSPISTGIDDPRGH